MKFPKPRKVYDVCNDYSLQLSDKKESDLFITTLKFSNRVSSSGAHGLTIRNEHGEIVYFVTTCERDLSGEQL